MDHVFPPLLTEFSSILVCPNLLKGQSFHVPTLPTLAEPEAVKYIIHIIIIINLLLSTDITKSALFAHFCPFWQNALKLQNLSEPSPLNTNALEAWPQSCQKANTIPDGLLFSSPSWPWRNPVPGMLWDSLQSYRSSGLWQSLPPLPLQTLPSIGHINTWN